MSRRKRALMLTLLALAVPLPAYAITNEVLAPAAGPSSISVSASLGSCGVVDDGVACEINVSFSEVENAASYTATVTRADGSVIDYGTVSPGGTSMWVPYVGAGTYSVKITAYGEPETAPGGGEPRGVVIATGYSNDERPSTDGSAHGEDADAPAVQTEAGSRSPGAGVNSEADGAATTDAQSADPAPAETTTDATTTTPETTTTTTTCTPVETAPAPIPPVEPPPDLDPDNPDEDADGIPDEQERATYEQQLAEYQAALAAQAPTVGC